MEGEKSHNLHLMKNRNAQSCLIAAFAVAGVNWLQAAEATAMQST